MCFLLGKSHFLGTLGLCLGLVLIAVSALSCSAPTSTRAPTPIPAAPSATPGLPPPEGNRIRIPAIGVDAPVTHRVVDGSGMLPPPDGADDVALYDFREAWPNLGGMPGMGNTMLTGRVDASTPCKNGTVRPPCEAVFWNLRRVSNFSPIQVFWNNQVYEYFVSAKCVISNSGKFDAVVARTPTEQLTLTTGIGNFDVEKRAYTHSLLVIALRISGPVADCPEGAVPGIVPAP